MELALSLSLSLCDKSDKLWTWSAVKLNPKIYKLNYTVFFVEKYWYLFMYTCGAPSLVIFENYYFLFLSGII